MKKTSRICMNLTQSSGTWLNGSLQKQMYYVSIDIKGPDGKIVSRASLTFEQAARMLLYNGDVECTLNKYRGEDGSIQKEEVKASKTVHERMTKRLDDTHTALKKRLFDIEQDLHAMVNGDKKRSKTAVQTLLHDVKVVKNHLLENEAFTVQQAEEELSEMQSNAAGQLGLYIQSQIGELPDSKLLQKLLPTGGEDNTLAILDKRIEPKIDNYELKERKQKPINDMTSLQVADALLKKLRQIEKNEGSNGENKQLFFSTAKEIIRGHKIGINYINYQSTHNLELDLAKRYLKFLLSIHSINQFKTHLRFEDK